MHITLETDYAIRIVDCLCADGGRVGAKTIAERTRVTLRFSLKILHKLVSSGMIQSFKGAQGGYEIAKQPAEICVYDIIETIEGPYMLSRCLLDGHICTRIKQGGYCPYHELFEEISSDVSKKLKSVTMADMLKKAKTDGPET